MTWSLKGFLRANPYHNQQLHVFAHEKPNYPGIIFSKNSPLTSIFQAGIQRLIESGTLDQVRTIWEGKYIRNAGSQDAMTLSAGQVVAAYAIMVVALASALGALALELLWSKLYKVCRRKKSQRLEKNLRRLV